MVLTSIQPEQAGNYDLVVTNNYGRVTNQIVVVYESPSIDSQPTNQTVFLGSNATFSVSAIGSGPLSYQWAVKGSAVPCCWVVLNDATNNVFTITNVQAADSGSLFRVAITNMYGSVQSTSAALTVLTPPTFTQQPQSQIKALSSNVTFSATVTGAQPIQFQWFFEGTPLTNGGLISITSGSTTTSLKISGLQTNDTGNYFLVASNLVGVSNSSVATLTVVTPPSIVQDPTNQTAVVGSGVTFSVMAGGSEPLAYQWILDGMRLSDGGGMTGWKTNALTFSSLAYPATNLLNVVVTNYAGSVTSAVATLIVYGVQITGQPLSQFVRLGSNASFTVTTIGQAPLAYQWYFNGTPLSEGGNINGSAAQTLIIANAQTSDGGGYRVVVTNSWSTATSATASLKLQANLSNAVLYVNANGPNPRSPYLDWSTAAMNIQDAVDSAIGGNLILVTNGVYNSGGAVVYGQETNRAALTKAVALLSVNGPETTVIVGGKLTRGVYVGTNAILSGFTITNGRARSGGGDTIKEQSGGGIWCEASGTVTNCLICSNAVSSSVSAAGGGVYGGSIYNCTLIGNSGYSGAGACRSSLFNSTISSNSTSSGGYGYGAGAYQCILSNCVVSGNAAIYNASGGGTAQGTNYNCILFGNSATQLGGGGGSYQSTNYNCILTKNSAGSGGGSAGGQNINCLIASNSAFWNGGGSAGGTHYNCLIVSNSVTGINGGGGGASGGTCYNCTIVNNSVTDAGGSGGGVYQSTLYNSIIYFNSGATGSNASASTFYSCCVAPGGSISSNPLLVDPAGGNFRLRTNSPCINTGNNSYLVGSNDLDGRPRKVGFQVDIGAYEFQTNATGEFIGWLQQHGLATSGSADYLDSDGDGFNNWQEWHAGTDPTSSSSLLQMTSVATTNNPSGATITWQSISGVNYFVQRGTNLRAQPVFSSIQSNIVGQAGTTSYTDATATNGNVFFYRVGAQ